MTRKDCPAYVLLLLPLLVASCQGDDKPPLPRYVSNYQSSSGQSNAAFQRSEHRYFIEFRSRYALTYGHSYVVFGQIGANGQMMSPEVAGLAPASNDPFPYVLGHFIPVPAETGESDGDLQEEYRSASWRVMLTEDEYRKVVAHIRALKAKSKVWLASVSNCNAFVADIARSMGYKTPSIYLRPQQFITRLRELNGG
jgi:hypothetical protein